MDNRKKFLLASVIVIVLFVITFTLFLAARKEEEKRLEKVEESAKEIEMVSEQVEEDMNEYMLANQFVMDHLPYEIESNKLYGHEHTSKQSMTSSELQRVAISQFYSAIKNHDTNTLLGSFSVEGYLDLLNSLESIEEMDARFKQIFDTLSKNDTLESIGLLENGSNEYMLFFIYPDGVKLEVPIKLIQEDDLHTKSQFYVISTPLEEILSYFEEK